MTKKLSTFEEFNENYPCEECSAPCCRYLIIPHKSPSTWMDLDFIRYMLNFPDINVTVSKAGEWGILIHQDCLNFDEKDQKCKVHNTSTQPKTCSYFNPYQCNYRLNLDAKEPNSIYILDREKFMHWVKYVKFSENGVIVDGPSFEKSKEILKKFEQQRE